MLSKVVSRNTEAKAHSLVRIVDYQNAMNLVKLGSISWLILILTESRSQRKAISQITLARLNFRHCWKSKCADRNLTAKEVIDVHAYTELLYI